MGEHETEKTTYFLVTALRWFRSRARKWKAQDKLPDLWLLDTESILKELDRAREIVRMIPHSGETAGPVRTAVDTIWFLRERIWELAVMQTQAQRRWQKKTQPSRTPEIRLLSAKQAG